MGRRIRFMLIESIARKTLGLQRLCVKEVIEEDGQLIGLTTGISIEESYISRSSSTLSTRHMHVCPAVFRIS
jgi:hypothetical protein